MSETVRSRGWSHDSWQLPPYSENFNTDQWVPQANFRSLAQYFTVNTEKSNYVLIASHIQSFEQQS